VVHDWCYDPPGAPRDLVRSLTPNLLALVYFEFGSPNLAVGCFVTCLVLEIGERINIFLAVTLPSWI
jgi:hypothetical protein